MTVSSPFVTCRGLNDKFQLGTGTADFASTPTTVIGTYLPSALSLGCGFFHNCAVNGTGAVQCWGFGTGGRLGTGSVASASVAVPVAGLPLPAIAASGGGFWDRSTQGHSCALLTDGTLSCWGNK